MFYSHSKWFVNYFAQCPGDEIQGSDSGISLHSRDGAKSRISAFQPLTTNKFNPTVEKVDNNIAPAGLPQDLSDLPFDMPKLRRRRIITQPVSFSQKPLYLKKDWQGVYGRMHALLGVQHLWIWVIFHLTCPSSDDAWDWHRNQLVGLVELSRLAQNPAESLRLHLVILCERTSQS